MTKPELFLMDGVDIAYTAEQVAEIQAMDQ